MPDATFTIRPATLDDVPALRALIATSVRQLSRGYLTAEQIDGELRYVISVDTQLIRDGTYYVAEAATGELAGAGGWSRRRLLHGGDAFREQLANDPHAADPLALLEPGTDAARIRAMFTHPAWTRRGVARALYETARAAAGSAGFTRLVLTATMPGVPLYEALGFTLERRYESELPDGTRVPVAEMTQEIACGTTGGSASPS